MSEETKQEVPLELAPENVTPIEEAQKSTKIDQKKQQILVDRMRRHIAAGKTMEQAFAAIQREDYERLPLTDKVKRLEGMLVGNIRGVAQDISTLRQNEKTLADVLDVNFRGFEKMVTRLGLPVEEQRKLLTEAEAEIKAEWAAQEEAKKEQQLKKEIDEPAREVLKPPEGATVFGG